jgi:hypothetical protein
MNRGFEAMMSEWRTVADLVFLFGSTLQFDEIQAKVFISKEITLSTTK